VAPKRRFWFSRTFLIIVGSILALLLLTYGWGLQTVMSWKYRQEVKRFPVLALTPQALPSINPNSSEGMKLSDAGSEFEVPWNDLDTQKTKYVGKIAIFAFRSGRVVEFFPPGPKDKDLLATLEEDFRDKDGNLRALFGPEAMKSNYALQKTMLEVTPSKMKPWMGQREAVRTSMLLLIKAVSSVGGETGLFKLEQNGWHGFQFDDPARGPKRVTLELYDSQDRHAEIIFFSSQKSPECGFTQADINRVVVTLRPSDRPATQTAIPRKNIIAIK